METAIPLIARIAGIALLTGIARAWIQALRKPQLTFRVILSEVGISFLLGILFGYLFRTKAAEYLEWITFGAAWLGANGESWINKGLAIVRESFFRALQSPKDSEPPL